MSSPPAHPEPLTLLLTCVGRRIELVQAFRAAAQRLGVALRLLAVDSNVTAPGLSCVDHAILVPRAEDPGYMPQLLDVVQQHGVRAVIPTTDTDLPLLAAERESFTRMGCIALIAEPRVITVCRNKLETYRFLHENGIDTPATFTADDMRDQSALSFPLFCKPRTGSASQRVSKINDMLDLEYYLRRYDDLIFQEFVAGQEYTLDIYVGLSGVPQCVVPRARWQVRTGEVSKGVTVKDPEIMETGRHVVAAFGDSHRGVVTLQCIVTPDRRIRVIEINPRLGGGAPLGIAAGADYPGWLIQELLGRTPQITFDGFRHGVCMLRYDWSAFVQFDDDLVPRLGPPLRPWPSF
jgi:carbamoyl-phosphate synthase large subunit